MLTKDRTMAGTVDELAPRLRALGWAGVQTMAGPVMFDDFDPYGAGRVGSVNLRPGKDEPVRLCLATTEDGRAWLADLADPQPPFLGGLFPLWKCPNAVHAMTPEEWDAAGQPACRDCY